MGYDTHIVIGKLSKNQYPEYKLDMDNPYEDGSGYPALRDKDGKYIETGRTKQFFIPMVSVDLCKIYDSEIEKIHKAYLNVAKETIEENVVYFYHSDGNTQFDEDNYGDPLVVAPFNEVLEAARKDAENNDYRRFKWLLGLMENMKDSIEDNVVCVFYGS